MQLWLTMTVTKSIWSSLLVTAVRRHSIICRNRWILNQYMFDVIVHDPLLQWRSFESSHVSHWLLLASQRYQGKTYTWQHSACLDYGSISSHVRYSRCSTGSCKNIAAGCTCRHLVRWDLGYIRGATVEGSAFSTTFWNGIRSNQSTSRRHSWSSRCTWSPRKLRHDLGVDSHQRSFGVEHHQGPAQFSGTKGPSGTRHHGQSYSWRSLDHAGAAQHQHDMAPVCRPCFWRQWSINIPTIGRHHCPHARRATPECSTTQTKWLAFFHRDAEGKQWGWVAAQWNPVAFQTGQVATAIIPFQKVWVRFQAYHPSVSPRDDKIRQNQMACRRRFELLGPSVGRQR